MSELRSPLFVMPKPANWNHLPLYKKVAIYRNFLGKFHSQFVDKIRVKKIVKSLLGSNIEVAKIVRILSSYSDLRETDITSNVIIKAAHGSKWNINIQEGKKYHLKALQEQLKLWNQLYNPLQEKQYAYLKPRFFLEEKINDKYVGKSGEAIVYMCRCFYGKVASISVKYGELRNDYDCDWNVIGDYQMPYIEKPVHLGRMIQNAETLSSLFEFVRMDFYIDHEDKIYLSEYTFTPVSGAQVLSNKLEYSLSKYWI